VRASPITLHVAELGRNPARSKPHRPLSNEQGRQSAARREQHAFVTSCDSSRARLHASEPDRDLAAALERARQQQVRHVGGAMSSTNHRDGADSTSRPLAKLDSVGTGAPP